MATMKGNRHKGKDAFKPYSYKIFLIFLFHTGIQSIATGEPDKKIV